MEITQDDAKLIIGDLVLQNRVLARQVEVLADENRRLTQETQASPSCACRECD